MNQEYLDICERSLRKYLTNSGDQFDVNHAVLMLECNVICRGSTNHPEADMICFLCASICVDCMDPSKSGTSDDLVGKFQRLLRYLREGGSYEQYGYA